jgi:hypothetical protein
VNWKSDLKLSDLGAEMQIEITCKHCGLTRYETPPQIMKQGRSKHAYLDEVEGALRCKDRYCNGAIRVSLTYDNTEGFVGGMA